MKGAPEENRSKDVLLVVTSSTSQNMANMAAASQVYQQMVVPDPYHYHQPQCQLAPTISSHSNLETKKDPKKRKKVIDKVIPTKKKPRTLGQLNSFMNSLRTDTDLEKNSKPEACPVCNKRKCYKHLDAK